MPDFHSATSVPKEVYSRFYDALPDRPRATDYLEVGSLPCPKIAAIKRRYVQFNKKNYSCKFLIFDVDQTNAGLAWHDADLPLPTFSVINQSNGHAHLTYELETPVHLGGNPSKKAICYLEIVRQGYTSTLHADTAYTGLLSKNPLSDHWEVKVNNQVYDLDRLAEPLREVSWEELRKVGLDQLEEKIKRSKIELPTKKYGVGFREEYAERGRNCFCFEHARFYAYEIVKECLNRNGLEKKIKHHINQLNEDFDERLPESEIRSSSRSIAKWTWDKRDHFTETSERFSERQRERQKLSADKKRKKSEQKIIEAIGKFQREGKRTTKAGIAREVGISREGISRYYSHLFKKV